MYAIIESGGKQYRVSAGDVLALESLEGAVGNTIKFDKVLLVGGEGTTLVGSPYLSQAQLEGEIVEQTRGEKLLTIKYRRRKGYRRTIGHRQELTRVLITKLDNGQGGQKSFDATKRNEILIKASVPFAEPKEKAPRTKKVSAVSEKATEKTTKTAKAAAPKKSTATKKKV